MFQLDFFNLDRDVSLPVSVTSPCEDECNNPFLQDAIEGFWTDPEALQQQIRDLFAVVAEKQLFGELDDVGEIKRAIRALATQVRGLLS